MDMQGAEVPVPTGFPASFAWGVATSAYQIEGGAGEDGKGESIWDRFARLPGRVAGGATGNVACDHYHRWRGDLNLMRDLGVSAYRFSVAWSRVLPEGVGRVNQQGLDFYDRLVDGLLVRGIEPWLTLYHWDLPVALEDRGGWPDRRTAAAFAEYADVVSRRLGDRVAHWITVNEPWEVGFLGYWRGVHAPGRMNLADALQAIHVLLLGHGRAAQAVRANVPGALIGPAIDLSMCYPASPDPADVAAAARMDGHVNRWFLDPLFGRGYPADMLELYGRAAPSVLPGDQEVMATPIDVLGLNYYHSWWVRHDPSDPPLEVALVDPPGVERTALGWSVHPEGLLEALARVRAEYGATRVAITESGACYEDKVDPDGQVRDHDRARYHARYLGAVKAALDAGVEVTGYFAWSLLDNFEWAAGYGPRFGLVRVDYATQRRTLKASARWYRRVIEANRGTARTEEPGGGGCVSAASPWSRAAPGGSGGPSQRSWRSGATT